MTREGTNSTFGITVLLAEGRTHTFFTYCFEACWGGAHTGLTHGCGRAHTGLKHAYGRGYILPHTALKHAVGHILPRTALKHTTAVGHILLHTALKHATAVGHILPHTAAYCHILPHTGSTTATVGVYRRKRLKASSVT